MPSIETSIVGGGDDGCNDLDARGVFVLDLAKSVAMCMNA